MISRPTSVEEIDIALELEAYEAKKPIKKDDSFITRSTLTKPDMRNRSLAPEKSPKSN